jgi:hypothetical protein
VPAPDCDPGFAGVTILRRVKRLKKDRVLFKVSAYGVSGKHSYEKVFPDFIVPLWGMRKTLAFRQKLQFESSQI